MNPELIEAAIMFLEQLVPALVSAVSSGSLDPDTAASYQQRIQAATDALPKPAGAA